MRDGTVIFFFSYCFKFCSVHSKTQYAGIWIDLCMLGFELSVQTVFVLMQPLSQIKRGDKELQGNNYVK